MSTDDLASHVRRAARAFMVGTAHGSTQVLPRRVHTDDELRTLFEWIGQGRAGAVPLLPARLGGAHSAGRARSQRAPSPDRFRDLRSWRARQLARAAISDLRPQRTRFVFRWADDTCKHPEIQLQATRAGLRFQID
jgi:hypothetical protein